MVEKGNGVCFSMMRMLGRLMISWFVRAIKRLSQGLSIGRVSNHLLPLGPL
jgi:hypothetical protein